MTDLLALPTPMRLDIHICPACRYKGLAGITVEQPDHLPVGHETWKAIRPDAWVVEPCGCRIDRTYWQVRIHQVGAMAFWEWEPLDA